MIKKVVRRRKLTMKNQKKLNNEWLCNSCGEYFELMRENEPETCPFCDSEDIIECIVGKDV